jgi:hypothetical protein
LTARDLIKQALRSLGVLASGENPTAEEAQDALDSLNQMIRSWRNERLMCIALLPERFPLVAGKKVYTIGTDGDFDTDRPLKIEKMQLIYQADSPLPLTLPLEIVDVDTYNNFVVPDTASTIPQWVYIDDGYPLRSIYFYTVPSIRNQVDIYTPTILTELATLDTNVVLPQGYDEAMRYNLAVRLAPEYAQEPSSVVVSLAQSSKALIKAMNNDYTPLLSVDPAVASNPAGWNWLTGD